MGVILTSIVILLGSNSPVHLPSPQGKGKIIKTSGISQLFELKLDVRRVLVLVCLVNGVGHLMTNYSMNSVAVSFTHTVKSAEPLFSVALTVLILGQSVSRNMYLTLIPIVFGVVLATTTELSYTHSGLITAMLSNMLFSTRNIYSKKLQNNNITSWTLFWALSVSGAIQMMILLVLGKILFIEVSWPEVSSWGSLFMASVLHAVYNQVSFMILAQLSPVSHAIGNAMRRVVIIYFSVMWFHTPVGVINVIGTLIACGGVLLYSRASQQHKKYSSRNKNYLNI